MFLTDSVERNYSLENLKIASKRVLQNFKAKRKINSSSSIIVVLANKNCDFFLPDVVKAHVLLLSLL